MGKLLPYELESDSWNSSVQRSDLCDQAVDESLWVLSILLIMEAILASAAMEFSIEWTKPFDMEVAAENFSLNSYHCMVFSVIFSKIFHASSSSSSWSLRDSWIQVGF